jgi:hypothetical protein
MNYITRVATLVVSIVVASTSALAAQTLEPSSLSQVINTYNANQARFVRDYRGKQFSGNAVLKEVRENVVVEGRFTIAFMAEGEEVQCKTENRETIDAVSDMNKGDSVVLSGTINDVTFHAIQLEPCTFSKQK